MTRTKIKPYLRFFWSLNDWTEVSDDFRSKHGTMRVLGKSVNGTLAQSNDKDAKQYIVWNLKTGNLIKLKTNP